MLCYASNRKAFFYAPISETIFVNSFQKQKQKLRNQQSEKSARSGLVVRKSDADVTSDCGLLWAIWVVCLPHLGTWIIDNNNNSGDEN
jgi:hypothetical protein